MSSEDKNVDELSGVSTTGHEWDGIRELNNPLPRWWLWTFYATIVFSIGYMAYYPAIPLVDDATRGISGTTNRSLLEDELKQVAASRGRLLQQVAETPLEEIRANPTLYRFSLAGGQSNYKVYCSQCHGSGAEGASGYPNLNDDDWLWGGDLEAIYTTIAHGVRNGGDEARYSEMPAFGRDEILARDEIKAVVHHVLQLSGQDHDASLLSDGAVVYADNCSACHGDNGLGNHDLGAPNLADTLALYGNTEAALTAQIINPNHGVMPGWLERLGEGQVKQLALYIHSLGGGEQTAALQE